MRNLIIQIFLAIAATCPFAMYADDPQITYLQPDYDIIADASIIKPDLINSMTISSAAGMELLMEEEDQNTQLAQDLLDYANTFIGTRYRRGGRSTKGFDCSGFTIHVFKEFGYSLGASSRSQYVQGEEIDQKSDILPGDLLFFGGRAGGKRVGHVGIAVDYDPETDEVTFIHSATSGGVRIDSTSAPYYKRRYIGARRVIGTM